MPAVISANTLQHLFGFSSINQFMDEFHNKMNDGIDFVDLFEKQTSNFIRDAIIDEVYKQLYEDWHPPVRDSIEEVIIKEYEPWIKKTTEKNNTFL